MEFHLREVHDIQQANNVLFFGTVMFKGIKVLSSFEWFEWLGMMCLMEKT